MIEKGSFETTRGNLQNMLQWIAAPLNDQYDKAYINLHDGQVDAIANMGEQVISYATFNQPYIHDVSIDADTMETVINFRDVQEYVNFVGGENVTVSFYGNEDERGCRKMQIDGDISVTIYVPSSKADYESQQTGIVNVYDDDENWQKPSDGEVLGTQFETQVSELHRIKKVKEFDDFALNTFPIVIEDGEMLLDATDENQRNSISGSLYAENVEGPDVSNEYSRGFAELVESISGDVRVQTEQDAPMSVVRRSNDDAIILRYTLLQTA